MKIFLGVSITGFATAEPLTLNRALELASSNSLQVKADQKQIEANKKAINEGLEQLDKGDYLTHSEVRSKIKEKFNF